MRKSVSWYSFDELSLELTVSELRCTVPVPETVSHCQQMTKLYERTCDVEVHA